MPTFTTKILCMNANPKKGTVPGVDVDTPPAIVAEPEGTGQPTKTPEWKEPIPNAPAETEAEKEKRIARESQSYFNKKTDDLVKTFVNFAKDNEALIDTLPEESDEDKAFKKKVREEFDKITPEPAPVTPEPNIEPYIQEPVKVDPSIDETIDMLQMTTPALQTEEGKSNFKKDYEMLNPNISHSDRVKYTLQKYTKNDGGYVAQPWNLPVSPPVVPQKNPNEEIEERRSSVKNKYTNLDQ